MHVLSIESSCDETSIAILSGEIKEKIDIQELSDYLSSFSVVSSVVSSQIQIHRKFGGVVPEVSARQHAENIHQVLKTVLEKASLTLNFLASIDYIFVTTEPGLISALRVGLEFAKSLQFFIKNKYGKATQIHKVNHLRGHVASCFYHPSTPPPSPLVKGVKVEEFGGLYNHTSNPLASQETLDRGTPSFYQTPLFKGRTGKSELLLVKESAEGLELLNTPTFPHLHLLVSGGNSQILLFKSWHEWEIVGQTLDDAAGECFDKAGRMLGLPYPGGVHISKISGLNDENSCNFPIGMKQSQNLDYSFSGLKTAVRYFIQKQPSLEFEKLLTQEEMNILLVLPVRKVSTQLAEGVQSTSLATQAPINSGTGENKRSLYETAPSKGAIGKLELPLAKGSERKLWGLQSSTENSSSKLLLIKNICISVQSVVVRQLMNKITLGIQKYSPVSLGLSGGVSANPLLRQKMQTLAIKNDLKLLLPETSLTGDNAVMISLAGLSDIVQDSN